MSSDRIFPSLAAMMKKSAAPNLGASLKQSAFFKQMLNSNGDKPDFLREENENVS